MPNVFDGIAEKAFNMLSIRNDSADRRPTRDELEEIDEVVGELYGFAFRVGGGTSESLQRYEVGYVLPKGATMRLNDITVVDHVRNGCSYFEDEPFVTITPVTLSDQELGRAELVGTPPEEALSGLKEFRQDLMEK